MTKTLNSIHRWYELYTGAFRTSPVKSLLVEAHDPHPELRRNELILKFLYKLKSSTTHTDFLNTLDDREYQKYEENKGAA